MADYRCGIIFCRNLRLIFLWPPRLPFHGLQLHLVRKRLFAGQQVFPLKVAVNHQDHRFIVGHFSHQHRHGGQAQFLRRQTPPMPADQLVARPFWPCQQGRQNAVDTDALGKFIHGSVLPHLIGMLFKRRQLVRWKLRDKFLHHTAPPSESAADTFTW